MLAGKNMGTWMGPLGVLLGFAVTNFVTRKTRAKAVKKAVPRGRSKRLHVGASDESGAERYDTINADMERSAQDDLDEFIGGAGDAPLMGEKRDAQ